MILYSPAALHVTHKKKQKQPSPKYLQMRRRGVRMQREAKALIWPSKDAWARRSS